MMHSKTFKTLLVVAFILIIGFSWLLIRDARKNQAMNTPIDTGLQDPFGTDGDEQDLPGGNNDPVTGSTGTSNVIPGSAPASGNIVVIENDPILKKLSDKAVAGFTFIKEERIIDVPDSVTPTAGIVETYDFSGYKTIRFGDKADEIVAIKTVLNRQTPSPSLVINTDYDTDMKNAVIDFQNKNGLAGDGVIGPKTYLKFNSFQGITSFTPVKKPDNIEIVDMVRFVDAPSGYIYDQALRKNEERVTRTETTIPKVKEAFFDNTGLKAVMRYLAEETIQTYVVTLDFPEIDKNLPKEERDAISKIAKVTGEFLPENIKVFDASNDKKSFFYLNPVPGGVAGITQSFATKIKKQVFDSPLTEWIADYASDAKIGMTTKASGLVSGYSYVIDTKTNSLTKSIGGNKGLTTLLSPDGKKLLYAESAQGSISTFILELTTGKATAVSPSALPEKCVWTKNSEKVYCAAPVKSVNMLYPDDWYKGKTTFDDALWVIDASDYSGNIVYDIFSKKSEKIDVTNIMLNAEDNYLGFINKKDGILWGFDLNK